MIGMVGLGLIGGSLAKALKRHTDQSIYGMDKNPSVTKEAVLVGAIDRELKRDDLPQCQILMVALYPEDTLTYLQEVQEDLSENTVVLDVSGVKGDIYHQLVDLAKKNRFSFIGTHPMAGLEHAGFGYSKEDLFEQASVILVPPKNTPLALVQQISELFKTIGFTNVPITSPEDHDRRIAYTSQLAHVLSNAYVKSPTAKEHHGFSAGSYKDLTRVAKLNEEMWTQLFFANKENLEKEIQILIDHLSQYQQALTQNRPEELKNLLAAGRRRKEDIDGEYF